jgi:hypothetical protein
MSIEIKGTIVHIGETKQVKDKMTKREVVIETADNPKYPQQIPIDLVNDRVSMADGLHVGDQVRAEVDLRGRAWTKPGSETKWFLSLNAWKIERVGAAQAGRVGDDPAPSGADDQIPF